MNLLHSYFTMELRLKKDDAGNLGAVDKLWVTNNLAHPIIKQIDLRLNGTLISPQSDTYHYKAYLETLMNLNREDGKTVWRPQGGFNSVDFPPQWTANNTDSTTLTMITGFCQPTTKQLWLCPRPKRPSIWVELVTVWCFNLTWKRFTRTGEIVVPGVEIKMKFHSNRLNLFLNGLALAGRSLEEDLKLQFHLCQLRLNEDVYKSISARKTKHPRDGQLPHGEIRTFNMAGTMTRFDIPNLFQNRIPDRMIVGLLDSRGFNGDVTRDPCCFQKFGLRAIRQMVKGEEYPYETLQINQTNGARDALGYFRYLQASRAWYTKQGNMVQQEDWGQGRNCTLFMSDNVANGRADNKTLNPKQAGELQLILEFRAAPNINITVLVYAEFENMLEIDSNGAVLYDIYQY